MYQALLTRKYLTSKIMPLLAMVAVALSVATVLVTWSIMGGFLKTLLVSGEKIVGDAHVRWPNVGFRHYEDLVERLEADPRIEAASPMVETFGLIQLPNGRISDVYVRGVDPIRHDRVTGYADTLWWKPITERSRKDTERLDPRVVAPEPGDDEADAEQKALYKPILGQVIHNGITMTRPDPETGEPMPAALMGIETSGQNLRTKAGVYAPLRNGVPRPDGGIDFTTAFLPNGGFIGITLLRLDVNGNPVDSISRRVPVANEYATGIYDHDAQTIMLPLDYLQGLLAMDEARRVSTSFSAWEVETDPETGVQRPRRIETIEIDPARVTTVLIKGADEYDGRELTPDDIAQAAKEVYAGFAGAHRGDVPDEFSIQIGTWASQQRTMIAAVKKETGLVLFIFGIVCFTTVFLVLAIFWSMVSEKTKDIGVLRSLGAGTWGVAWLWLRYGIAIGVVGAAVGTVAGYLITNNINAIHEWIGEVFNIAIWDPTVYYFVEIPREVELHKAVIVAAAGVLTCLVGAAIPAVRAAKMDPVRALRFE